MTGRVPTSARNPQRWRAGPAGQHGRWGYILAWLLGVPIPILLIVYLLRGWT